MERITEPFIIEEDLTGIIRTGKICNLDADFIKHFADIFSQKIITENFIDDIEEMKKVYRTCALEQCENIINFIRDPIIFCFSGKSSNTFRYHIALEKEYKGGRNKNALTIEEELLRMDLRHEAMLAVMKEYICLLFDDLEADDLLCMLQDEDTYIYSKDKDLLQVPGWHLDVERKEIYKISEEDAIRFLAKQLLTGDTTDCIPGMKGIGPKTADKLLDGIHPKNMISMVYKQYRLKYGIVRGTDLFSNNWNLIKMRENHGDYFKNKYEKAYSIKETIKKNLNLNL